MKILHQLANNIHENFHFSDTSSYNRHYDHFIIYDIKFTTMKQQPFFHRQVVQHAIYLIFLDNHWVQRTNQFDQDEHNPIVLDTKVYVIMS